jgi:quercetin dioxygenase-like cupin family protein
LGEQNLEGNQ